MTPVIPKPPSAPTPLSFRERLQAAHNESVSVGPTGPLVLFFASVTSAFVLAGKGVVFLYNRCRGYA
jgi:hypothetical protein